jgi:hypothetical protein
MHDQRVSRQQPIRRPYIRIDKLFSLLRALDPPRIVREKPLPEDERRRNIATLHVGADIFPLYAEWLIKIPSSDKLKFYFWALDRALAAAYKRRTRITAVCFYPENDVGYRLQQEGARCYKLISTPSPIM